jgi:phosphate transport system substrate-binding protein
MVTNTDDFAGADSLASDAVYASTPDLQYLPVLAGSIVPLYNVPELGETQLVLTRSTLALIFCGVITRWNDTRIAATNPGAPLPNKGIQVIIRSDSSGTTFAFTEAMAKFDPLFGQLVGSSVSLYPIQYRNGSVPNFFAVPGNAVIAAQQVISAYAISYTSLSWTRSFPVHYAALINVAGNVIRSAEAEATSEVVDSAVFDARFTTSLVDSPLPQAWPLISFTYLLIRTGINSNCVNRRELLRFLRWALTDTVTASRAQELGYVQPATKVTSLILQKLGEVQCSGELLLGATAVVQHSSPAFVAMLVLACLSCALAIVLGAIVLAQARKTMVNTEKVFLSLMLVGSIVALTSVGLWYAVPSSTGVCLARVWLMFLGMSIALSALFSRLTQIYFIWVSFVTARRMTRERLMLMFFGVFGIGVLLQVILLAIWTGVDPFGRAVVSVSDLDITTTQVCTCSVPWVWFGLEIALFSIVLLWGVIATYSTWQLKEEVSACTNCFISDLFSRLANPNGT